MATRTIKSLRANLKKLMDKQAKLRDEIRDLEGEVADLGYKAEEAHDYLVSADDCLSELV